MNLSDALPFVGQYLTMAQSEAQELPNEYTRGQLQGIQRVYSGIIAELQHPGSGKPQVGDEDIPFTNPPVNPQTGQMQKYGNEPQGWNVVPGVTETSRDDYDRRPDLQAILLSLQETNTVGANMMIGELAEIRQLLQEIRDQNNEPIQYDNPFPPPSIDEETRESADEAIKRHEELHNDPRIWNQSFGDRLQGKAPDIASPKTWSQYQEMVEESKEKVEEYHQQPSFEETQKMAAHEGPAMEEYMDVETGEMVRQREIGRIRFDDEYEPPSSSNAENYQEWVARKEAEEKRKAEDWQHSDRPYPGTQLGGPYVVRDGGDQYGLEDLTPGG